MSEVTLSIGGRKYTVACADGEEAHVQSLGESIDAKFSQMGNLGTPDSQNFLFTSLLLADDLHEARKGLTEALEKQASLEQERDKALGDANVATGQREELRQAVADREVELSGLQTAQQSTAAEVAAANEEVQALKSAEKTRAEAMNTLRREADALRSERATLERRLNELIDNPAGAKAPAGSDLLANDPELALALERFAELLENCADKLEAGAATS